MLQPILYRALGGLVGGLLVIFWVYITTGVTNHRKKTKLMDLLFKRKAKYRGPNPW